MTTERKTSKGLPTWVRRMDRWSHKKPTKRLTAIYSIRSRCFSKETIMRTTKNYPLSLVLRMTPCPSRSQHAQLETATPQESQRSTNGTGGTSTVPLSRRRFLVVDMKLERGIGEVKVQLEYAVYAARQSERSLFLPRFLYFRGCVNGMLCERSLFPKTILWPFTLAGAMGNGANDAPRSLKPRYVVPIERIYDIPNIQQYIDVKPIEEWIQLMA